jgi:clan AA aspartic protease
VTGVVDLNGRALLPVRLRHPIAGAETLLDVWIDTGFTGDLVVPAHQITLLNLPRGPMVRATLADGSEVDLETYTCHVDWFGTWKSIEVVANQGQLPLLGVGLLRKRHLDIDYRANTLNLT